jgi:hypothetical protein
MAALNDRPGLRSTEGLHLPGNPGRRGVDHPGQRGLHHPGRGVAPPRQMTLAGASWSQEPQKYHARSLAELRRKFAAAAEAPGLQDILAATDCLKWLRE